MESLTQSATYLNVKGDWLKVGAALITSQLLSQRSLNDKDWMKSSLLTLIGFTAYHLITSRLVDSSKFATGNVRKALDDILKVGGMLVVSRLLSGQPLNDETWMKESAYVLLGFVAFDLTVGNFIDTSNMSSKAAASVTDVAKFSTMYAVSRFMAGKEFNKAWAIECAGFMGGLVGYNYFLADL
jgi:predicted tellurium resistance membrane protein TerC